MCLNIGTPKNHHFPFVTNGKVVVLGVPSFKHFRVKGLNFSSYTISYSLRTYEIGIEPRLMLRYIPLAV